MSNENVKNLRGTTDPACACSSFLCHWENYSGTKATVCSRLGCTETKNLLGGHVIKCHGNAYAIRYIVPICPSCNKLPSDECYGLKKGTLLVPVTDRHKCKPCR